MIATLVVVGCGKKDASGDVEKTEAKTQQECIQSIIGNMVAIPGKNFKMGKYEVTQAQWQAVMGDNPSCYKDPDNPVERVSLYDCKMFLEKLNAMPEVRKNGLTFRLPTNEEWEYACRAGGTGDYCRLADGTEVTKDTLGKVAWFKDNSGGTNHPVGQKEPNAFGLYDIHGNVCEWCKERTSEFACRGGSRLEESKSCTAVHRSFGCERPSERCNDRGFRLVASQD